jgi:phosphatidate cytidylyltransferase
VLKLRVLTIAVLLPAFAAAAIYLPGIWWSAILFAAVLVAAGEWSRLAGFGRAMSALFYFVLGLACTLAWMYVDWDNRIYAASILFWSIAVPLALWRKPELRGSIVLAIAGIFVLVPMWLAMVRLQADAALLFALLAIVWISDIAAYGAGRAWGRHKLAPSISPGKTWEGVAGAFAAVAVYAAAFHFCWFPAMDFGFVLTAFFAIAALGIVGDLFESLLKRGAGVKDSGWLLPGHGGVLDRIDAMTAALPLATLLFTRS